MFAFLCVLVPSLAFISAPSDTSRDPASYVRIVRAMQLSPAMVYASRGQNPRAIRVEVYPADPSIARKSPAMAVLRSIGGTFLPVGAGVLLLQSEAEAADWIGGGALVGGIVIGPAMGHYYAQAAHRARRGIAIRGATLLVGTIASAVLFASALGDAFEGGDGDGEATAAAATALGSVLVIAGSAIYDFATADDAARAYNARHGFAVQPLVHPIRRQAGLALRWTF